MAKHTLKLGLLLGLILVLLLFATSTLARPPEVSKSTYLKLTRIQELIDGEQYDTAISELKTLANDKRTDTFDFARIHHYLAHTYVLSNQPDLARQSLATALDQPGLPDALVADMKLFFGQVLLKEQEYDLARTVLEEWIATSESPVPLQLFSVGYANYMTDQFARAEVLLKQAIDGSESPSTAWYQIYYRTLAQQKKYREAERILFFLINKDQGQVSHWRLLINHYMLMEKEHEALAAMMVAYRAEAIGEEESDLKRLISLHAYVEAPEKAARLLQGWMTEDSIPTNATTLKQLGDLWLLSRERDKAKAVLEQAANLAPDGKTFERLGSIHFEDEDWAAAYGAFVRALELGGLNEPARVSLIAGISAFRAELLQEAEVSLKQAAKSPDYRSQAEAALRKIKEAGG